jgi:hypothetical protein
MKPLRKASFARAAMVGLLAAAHLVACNDEESPTNTNGDGDGDTASTGGEQQGDGTGGEGTEASGGRTGSGGLVNTGAGGTFGEMGGGAGEGGAGGAAPLGVISTEIIPDLSLAEFTEMCGQAGGVVETHASCGGVVSGPGFSYDDATDAFTEHTCAGYNTCSGFSCVIDD